MLTWINISSYRNWPGNNSVTFVTKLEMFFDVLSCSICMQNFVEFELIITEFAIAQFCIQ